MSRNRNATSAMALAVALLATAPACAQEAQSTSAGSGQAATVPAQPGTSSGANAIQSGGNAGQSGSTDAAGAAAGPASIPGDTPLSSTVPDGDIVVTATRNESLASKTPVALTAITGGALITAGITDPTRLGDQVPNISIDRASGLQITIRGVTSTDQSEKGDPSAAFMLDGIYIARPNAQDVSFFDINRVEVLRGPQGTLFGRNTTAGLVNVITNNPDLTGFHVSADGTYGNYNTQQVSAMVNIPINSWLAIRAAGNYDRRDAYIEAGPNFRSRIDPYKDNRSGRLSALFDLGKGRLVLRGDYSDIQGQTQNQVPLSNFYSNFTTTGATPLYIGNQVSTDAKETINVPFSGSLRRNDHTWGIQGDLSYDLGPITVNYLGSYRELHRDEGILYFRSTTTSYPSAFTGDFSQNSQEVRLSGGTGPLKAQVGGYYFRERSSVALYLNGFASPTPGTTGYVFGFVQSPTISESYAGFGQLTYSIFDRLRVTGGVRYSHDDKSRVGSTVRCQTTSCNLSTDLITPNLAARSFAKTTWRAGIDFDLNARSLLYASVSTGYKAGGFNDGCLVGSSPLCTLPANALYYNPETLTAYEAGLKTRFLDNAVRVNLAAFHYDYSGLQLSQISNLCGYPCNVTTNAGKAKVDGAEAELVITPSPENRFDFAGSWLNARYVDFNPSPAVTFDGRKLDRSPAISLNAGYTYTLRLGNGANIQPSVRTRLSDSYQLTALAILGQFRVPSYTKTDLSVTYNAPRNAWYLQGFVRNVENSIVVTALTAGTFATAQFSDPRTFGGRAGFRF